MQWFWSPPKIKSVTVSIVSPSICHEVMGLDSMILVFWMLSFKPIFHSPLSLSSRGSLVFLQILPSVVSSAYLRLLIFLPAILIPACASSSPAYLIIYSTYKLNKQGDSIQPWHTPFLIWNLSVPSSNCSFLICIQISQEAGQVVWYFHLFKKFPLFVVIHSQRLWHSQ